MWSVLMVYPRSSKHARAPRTDEKTTYSKKANGYEIPSSTQVNDSKTPSSKTNTSRHQSTPSSPVGQNVQNQSSHTTQEIPETKTPVFLISGMQSYYYPGNTEYATAIMNGTASLGIEVPDHLHHSLVDRYGQYGHWSATVEILSNDDCESFKIFEHLGSQALEYDASSGFNGVPYPQVVRQERKSEHLSGDLVGIGAQFDY